jgi:hypothetical protein
MHVFLYSMGIGNRSEAEMDTTPLFNSDIWWDQFNPTWGTLILIEDHRSHSMIPTLLKTSSSTHVPYSCIISDIHGHKYSVHLLFEYTFYYMQSKPNDKNPVLRNWRPRAGGPSFKQEEQQRGHKLRTCLG